MAVAKRIIVEHTGNNSVRIYKEINRTEKHTTLIYEGESEYIPIYILKEMQYSKINIINK